MSGVLGLVVVLLTAPGLAGSPRPDKETLRSQGRAAMNDWLHKSRAMMAGDKPRVKPGDWVTYRMRVSPGSKAALTQIESLVTIRSPLHTDPDKPLPAGHFWLEFELADPTAQSEMAFTLKMLIGGDPRDAKAIKRMFIKAGDKLPMELGPKWLDTGESDNGACTKCDAKGCAAKGGKVRRGKQKKLYTKLGWLKARRVLIELPGKPMLREYWFSDQVPLFGIVRASLEERIEMELEGYGTGALSRIDETRSSPLPDPEDLKKPLPELDH